MIKIMKAPPPAAVAPPPRITAGRAYGEMAGLFALVFGRDVINAVKTGWTAVAGAPPGWLAWWDHSVIPVGRVAFVAGVCWLIALRPWKAIRPELAMTGLAIISGLRVMATIVAHHAPATATSLDYLARTGLTIALAAMLAHHRGLTLTAFGLSSQSGHDRRTRYIRARDIAYLSLLGFSASGIAVRLFNAVSGLPTAPSGFEASGIHDIPTMVIACLHAGICEEAVLVATLVTALEAARRPTWQITTAGLGMRLAIHLYFGISAPAALIFAAINTWLFRRTRRLLPLIAVHVMVDLTALITMLGGPLALPIVLLGFFAVDALITRGHRPHPTPPVGPEPPTPTGRSGDDRPGR